MVKRCNNSENQCRKRCSLETRKIPLVENEDESFSQPAAIIIRHGPEYINENSGNIICRSDCSNGSPETMTGRPEYINGSPVSRSTAGGQGSRDVDTGRVFGSPVCNDVNAETNADRQDWTNGSLELVSSSKEWTSGYQELVNRSHECTSGGSPASDKSNPSWKKSPEKTSIYSPDRSGTKEAETERGHEKEQHVRPKRRGSGSNTYVAAHLPKGAPCKVCGLLATGNHYDSITCEGCKGFFRRTVQNNKQDTYSCSNGGSCIVEGHKRSSCKRCRYDKCIEIGMNPEKVLDEYERQKLNNQKADNRRKREEERRKSEQTIQNDAKTKNCSVAVARRRHRNPIKQTKKLEVNQILSSTATPGIRRSTSNDSLLSLVNRITKQFKDMCLHAKPTVDDDFCSYLKQLTELRECLKLALKSCDIPYHCCFVGSGAFLRAQQSFLQSMRKSNKLRYEFFTALTCLEKSADEAALNDAGVWQWFWMRMLTTYDPMEDAVILDTGLMISRSQRHFFGCLVPETIFDLASRLHLLDPDLRVVMLAALSALATIDPDVQQPADIQLMENNLLEGIRIHLDEFSNDPYSTFEMFVNVQNELHELCRTIRSILSVASDERLFDCYVRLLIDQTKSKPEVVLY